ncbi:hypothetical protein Zmor_012810 [Zophobas morio]|uniref:Uncharacterized protein n=1 Tax=Zophobas morio TaxID=2755281 RepID=A0AA38IC47_9CUCU|nr:hypothetical protein Zmor_012810 [Zophobas morio]
MKFLCARQATFRTTERNHDIDTIKRRVDQARCNLAGVSRILRELCMRISPCAGAYRVLEPRRQSITADKCADRDLARCADEMGRRRHHSN